MPTTNDFLPFAVGAGANVLSQSDYAALAALTSGFQAGTAISSQLNKVWRQSSIMSAVLAQFIVNNSGQSAADDGTTATLLANFTGAVHALTRQQVVLADTGAANAYTAVNATPLVAGTWIDGVVQAVKIAHANTGASTYAPDGLAAIPIYGLGLQPLQGGELFLNGIAILMHATIVGVNSGNPIAVLMECAGGAQQIAPGTQPQHAVQFSQVASPLGAINARVYTAASSSFMLTADRVIAATALSGGLAYATSGFSKTINLATTGAGGMDTGSAPTSGYVAIYAIYNPTTTTWALLATNATSAAAPEVYSGANMPAGYTASCLVSVWGTTSTANQFRAGLQRGRHIAFPPATVLSSTTPQASYTALSISSAVPPNAIQVFGNANPQSSAASTLLVHIAADGGGTDDNYIVATSSATGSVGNGGVWRALLSVAQTIYYSWTNTAGSPQLGMSVVGYIF